jgi:hypothetical protein
MLLKMARYFGSILLQQPESVDIINAHKTMLTVFFIEAAPLIII